MEKSEKRHVLQLHVTHLCNLRCKHCYQEEYLHHMERELFFRVLSSYEAYLSSKGMAGQINLTGGEPLLHPDFFLFCEEIVRRGFRFSVLTNGTLIDPDTARRLAGLHPAFVQVSLDGDEKTHDKIRGEGNFRYALRGIDCLKAEGIRVLVSFTAQKENYRSFGALARICRRHRVDKLWWDRVVTDDPALFLTTEEFLSLVKSAGRIRRTEMLFCGKSAVHNGRAMQFLGDRSCGGYRCEAGGDLIVILADGSVMPCRRLPYVIGNVREKMLSDIIRGSRCMLGLRQSSLPELCLKCEELYRCHGGAKCVTCAQTGSYAAPDVNCPYRNQNRKGS